MNSHRQRKEDVDLTAPGTALDSSEGADVMQTVKEAKENDELLRDDLQDDELITLDTPD